MANLSDVVPAYIKLRDHIEALEREHKEALKPLKEKLEFFETWLLGELESRGEDSATIRGVGVVFKKKETKCTMADWATFFPWMQSNERYDMLNHAVNKTTVT